MFFLLIFLSEGFECGKRSYDLRLVGAVSYADVSAYSEVVAGNNEYLVSLCALEEFICVVLQSLYKEVESSVGLYAFIAVCGEVIVKKISVLLVRFNVNLSVYATCDYLLEEAGGANVSKGSARDVGSIINGDEAVEYGIIDKVGGLCDALEELKGMMGREDI